MARTRVQCPGCAAQGRDNSKDNLSLFPDDARRGWCVVCQKAYSVDGEATRNTVTREAPSGLDLAAIQTLPFRALEDRGISEETCKRFGVRVAVDEATATVVTDHYYPYSHNGEVVGYKRRRLPKQFAAVGKIKGLFGQQQCKGNARMLICCEGEVDAMSAHQMLRSLGKNYNVVSLPNGANEQGTIDATTRKELEFFTAHELVVICLDEDEPGQTTAKALAELLISQCKVKLMRLNRKDSNEYLKAGDAEGWWGCLRGAKDYEPEAIENGSVSDVDELLSPEVPGVFLDFLPGTMSKMYGLRAGEVTVLVAPPGAGKTTLCRQITYGLLSKQPDPVFNIFLEEKGKKTRQGILALHAGVALNHIRRGHVKVPRAVAEYTNSNILNRLELLVNNKILLTDDTLLNKINYFVKAKGCKFGILDHFSYVIASRDGKDERKEIDTLFTKITQLAEDTGLHLIVIVHIKRRNRERDQTGKAKYPFWELLELSDGRGSGAFEQLAHNFLVMEQEVVDPSSNDRGNSRIRIVKNREEGTIGIGDILKYNTVKGALEPIGAGY